MAPELMLTNIQCVGATVTSWCYLGALSRSLLRFGIACVSLADFPEDQKSSTPPRYRAFTIHLEGKKMLLCETILQRGAHSMQVIINWQAFFHS